MDWIFDIASAPRGSYEIRAQRIKGGKTADHEVFERDVIWTASKCGKVTRSYYLPLEKRWCMYAHGEEPVAWMPFDEAIDGYEVIERGKTIIRYRCPLAHPHEIEGAA